MVGETVNMSGQSSCTPVKVPECRLSDDLGSLFERSAFSDVTLCINGHEFQAHKAILAGKFHVCNNNANNFYLYSAIKSNRCNCSVALYKEWN